MQDPPSLPDIDLATLAQYCIVTTPFTRHTLHGIARGCRVTSAAVVMGCLPLNPCRAQPWLRIDRLWGSAVWSVV